MLGLALLRVQAALPQHVPQHVDDILLHAKEVTERQSSMAAMPTFCDVQFMMDRVS